MKADMTKGAIFPGSFDPPTLGHVDLIQRGARMFERMVVVVADNSAKSCLFSTEERVTMLQAIFQEYANIEVVSWSGLVVEYAKQEGISVLVRGIRGVSDFGYEFELAMTNKHLAADIETVLLPTDPRYMLIRASGIKELATYGIDVSSMVPEIVAKELTKKIKNI